MKKYFKDLISPNSEASAKRFITLIIALHFIIASFVVLFFAFYVIVYLPKGKPELSLTSLLMQILEYDFYIILAGLGFITGDNLFNILLEKAKVTAAANIATGSPTADKIQVDNVNVTQKPVIAPTVDQPIHNSIKDEPKQTTI